MSVFHNKDDLHFYIPGIISKKYTYKQVSQSTNYSIRQLQRIVKRYKKEGENAFIHRGIGHVAYNKIPEKLKNEIITIYQTECTNEFGSINFLYYRDYLIEVKNICISYPTLRKILNKAGIQSPEIYKSKRNVVVHRPRPRREHEGDLLQIDGTPFPWFIFFGNFTYYDMMGGIDDATSKITAMHMSLNECLYGYLEVKRQTILRFGRPREEYMDMASIFCCTPKKKENLTIWEQLEGVKGKSTQYQRILAELHIKQILAKSPQAKGRVERMWRTVQWRLPFWLYLNGIKTIEEANRRMPEFIEYYNNHFSEPAKKQETYWLPAPENLDDILCAQITRTTDSSGCFSFHGYKFTILGCSRIACKKITLCISEKGINARLDGKYYKIKLLDDYIHDVVGDNIPQVLKEIMYKYLYEDHKEVSA